MMTDAHPFHLVQVDGFWIDPTPVTNEEYDKFVLATGYVTVAEKIPDAKLYPNAPKEKLIAGSAVFIPPDHSVPLDNHYQWWGYVPGANWRHPEGPLSSLKGREIHPVVQVSWEDSSAYCHWKGGRLPSEAEFEFAARGGLERKRYAWGDELKPDGRWMANLFQGDFPSHNSIEDGYAGTSPVKAFPPNGYGLYDMAGNVWEWCNDWYRADYYLELAKQKGPVRNPQGPPSSLQPGESGMPRRVQRGGSFLCTPQYCSRYEVGARGRGDVDSGANHLGFRCVQSKKMTGGDK